MTRQVYIVRHGNTFDPGDTVTRVGARTDLPLSTSGKAQAQALAEHFASTGVSFGAAYSSPLKRTRQTAETILEAQPTILDLEFLGFLREVDYGPDENKPEAEVIARIGEEAIKAWDENAEVPPGWEVDPVKVLSAWGSFFSEMQEEPEETPILVLTSNGIARFALQLASNVGETSHQLKLKTGAYGIVEIGHEGMVSVRAWNERP